MPPASLLRPVAARWVAFFVFWVLLAGGADPLLGAAAAAAATGVSLRLLPAGQNRIDALALCRFTLRFLGQSVGAGIDVARRSLDPALPLAPGLVRYASALPPGAARNLFTSVASLVPGTLPIGPDTTGALLIHCLDARQPVAALLAEEEALLRRVIGRMAGDG